MTKQRPNPDKLANELAGASAFSRPQPPEPTTPATLPAPTPTLPMTPELAAVPDATTPRRHDVTPATSPPRPAGFDLNRTTASRDSLRLSLDETRALDELRAALKWDYDLVVSKNDICRAALHWLLEDFAAKGEKSSAVTRLRRKQSNR